MAAIQSYRNLLRAARIAFEGDTRMLTGARESIRNAFRDKATLPPSDPSIEPALKHADEVAAFLKANVVQGIKQEDNTYKLRIHEHTERGDNESIKFANKNPRVGVKCCSEM
ncbi:Mitochondrial zinc maintenance protein 1, mitochondrial [Podospora pseudocomata]|nr:Mitochondrial zinc maintenance protein 1, mitochondrial [Podospora bellae-mahoneyi]KAK4660058.1 Mitochondrial zinc maintenance protein 1, mitochondrial [Podospora pseudocomata]VBB73094.1 Putative protein of unknown function [Podospora comata]